MRSSLIDFDPKAGHWYDDVGKVISSRAERSVDELNQCASTWSEVSAEAERLISGTHEYRSRRDEIARLSS